MVGPVFIALKIPEQLFNFHIVGFNNEEEKRKFTNAVASVDGVTWTPISSADAFDILINEKNCVGYGCYIQSMDYLANLERKAHAAYNMLTLGPLVGISTLARPIPVLGFPAPPVGSNNAH